MTKTYAPTFYWSTLYALTPYSTRELRIHDSRAGLYLAVCSWTSCIACSRSPMLYVIGTRYLH